VNVIAMQQTLAVTGTAWLRSVSPLCQSDGQEFVAPAMHVRQRFKACDMQLGFSFAAFLSHPPPPLLENRNSLSNCWLGTLCAHNASSGFSAASWSKLREARRGPSQNAEPWRYLRRPGEAELAVYWLCRQPTVPLVDVIKFC
jgi:hypothetical protein